MANAAVAAPQPPRRYRRYHRVGGHGGSKAPEETEGGGSSSSYKGTSPRSHQIVAFARAESRPSRLESLCGSLLGHQSWGMPRCSHTRRGRIHGATAVTGRRDPVRPVLRGEGRGGEGGEGGRQGRLVFRPDTTRMFEVGRVPFVANATPASVRCCSFLSPQHGPHRVGTVLRGLVICKPARSHLVAAVAG